jgi:hypothetical protein
MTVDMFHGASTLDMLSAKSLSEDLDAPARRRFWLVAQLIARCNVTEVESALTAAAKVEAFIANGGRSSSAPLGSIGFGAAGPSDLPDMRPAQRVDTEPSPAPAALSNSQNIVDIGGKYRNARRQLLDKETRSRFIHEAAVNPDNRHLAQLFGLSVRQAHAIRVGLSKFIADGRREIELQMQDDFLKNKSAAGATMDDVVRYLRQINDVVVPNGPNYVVNYKLALTAEQLLERANAKRRERKQAPLMLETAGLPCGASPLPANGAAEEARQSAHI